MVPNPRTQHDRFESFPAGTTIAITGAGSGIGRASAQLLAERGAAVVLMDQHAEGLEGTVTCVESVGGQALSITGDITSSDDVQATVDACLRHSGRMDGLVHCAGIGGGNSSVQDMSQEQWASTLTVNATGTFLMNKAAIAPMLAQGYGRIVNVASIAGLEGNPNAAHYSASKAAVIAFTKALGKELARTGILVNAVAPAVIATEMLSQVTDAQLDFMLQKIPMGRPGPSEAAHLISFLVSRQLSFSTGAMYDLSGGRATY